MHKKHNFISIISRVVLAVGIIVGIIFTAIGSTMILNSSLKLAFFNTSRYSMEWELQRCGGEIIDGEFETRAPIPYGVIEEEVGEKTEEEIKECEDRVLTNAKKEFTRDQGGNIIDGFSFLFVGLLLWIAFGIWGKKMNLKEEKKHEEQE